MSWNKFLLVFTIGGISEALAADPNNSRAAHVIILVVCSTMMWLGLKLFKQDTSKQW